MRNLRRSPSCAALFDAVCLVVFVIAGRETHGLDSGAGLFFVVLWPIAAAWFTVALLARLYTTRSRARPRLFVTVAVGVGLGLIVRIAVTHRDTPVAFVLVAYAFITVTTVGWRLVAAVPQRVRALRRHQGLPASGEAGRAHSGK